MISKERVLTAMGHREPDRVPRYLFYTPEVFKKLSRILKIDTESDLYIFDIEMENDLLMTYRGISNIPGVLHSEATADSGQVFYDSLPVLTALSFGRFALGTPVGLLPSFRQLHCFLSLP